MDIESLLSSENVNQEALLAYAKDAANFSTNYQLPSLQFALNHRNRPDVDMFDFTCMNRSENAALVRDCNGTKLLIGLVGDCLVEVSAFFKRPGQSAWEYGQYFYLQCTLIYLDLSIQKNQMYHCKMHGVGQGLPCHLRLGKSFSGRLQCYVPRKAESVVYLVSHIDSSGI